jgi:pyruvate-formate lyase-activating enzyme
MGCNFAVPYCSNAYIAKEGSGCSAGQDVSLSPVEVVRKAKQMGCRSIVFNVNERPFLSPSLLALAEEARREGLPMGCLTNAYTTEESTELLASIFLFSISVKRVVFLL